MLKIINNISKKQLLQLVFFTVFSLIFYLFFCDIPDLKPNEIFVRYAVLIIFTIFSLVFVFLHQTKVLRYTVLIVLGMFGFGFVLVPIYDVFCDVTGLNGKIDLSITAGSPKGIDLERDVTVEFVVNYNKQMPWNFKPQHVSLKLHPGELARTAYYAKNPTKKTMRAQAIPSISPSRASRYFKKVECFCFSSQQLGPSETAHLGLQFYLDPELPKDIKRLTLSYTLFDITENPPAETMHHG